MQAMTILRRCRKAKQDLQRLDLQLERRQDAMRAFGGIRMDDIGGSRGGGGSDRMARMSAEIDEIERAIQDRKEARMAEVGSAIQLIDMLEDDMAADVLYRYYVTGDGIAGISRAIPCDRSYVQRKKKDGESAMRQLAAEKVAETLPGWYLVKWKEEEDEDGEG